MTSPVCSEPIELLSELRRIVAARGDRVAALQAAADTLHRSGGYRWVGLYGVDHANGMVRNIVWSGPGAPAFPTFPIGKGLTGSAISLRKTVNVGDVTSDSRYLTAFGSTRSEIIVPVFDLQRDRVVGTLDIESEHPNAFNQSVQDLLEKCARVLEPLW